MVAFVPRERQVAVLDVAPTQTVTESVTLPRLEPDGGGRRVVVWFQLESGSRVEQRTYAVSGDNSVRAS